uniref:Uncharacterized protein n=1 Tax=Madurella sp. TaxID=2420206 RepID=A0AAU7YTV1_9PEZI
MKNIRIRFTDKIGKFFLILGFNLLKYIIFILPFILIGKALYLCFNNDVWNLAYFSQQLISNLPFCGKMLSQNLWGNNLILSLDMIQNNQKFTEFIVAGGLGSCFGRSIYESFFYYFKLPALAGSAAYVGEDLYKTPYVKIPLVLQSTQDSNLNLGSGAEGSTGISVENTGVGTPTGGRTPPSYPSSPGRGTAEQEAFYRLAEPTPLWKQVVTDFYAGWVPGHQKLTQYLIRLNNSCSQFSLNVPVNNTNPDINEVSLIKHLQTIIEKHSEIITNSFNLRDHFINDLRHYLNDEDKAKIDEITRRIEEVTDDYINKLGNMNESFENRTKLKVFFDSTNSYRNTLKKEYTAKDVILQKGLKQHPVFENKDFKKMINSDYRNTLKSFHDQEGYLKKRITEIFNEPKRNN